MITQRFGRQHFVLKWPKPRGFWAQTKGVTLLNLQTTSLKQILMKLNDNDYTERPKGITLGKLGMSRHPKSLLRLGGNGHPEMLIRT